MQMQADHSRRGYLFAGAMFIAALASSAQVPSSPSPASTPATADSPPKDQPIQLEAFTVSGYRASLQKSLDTKRESNAIVDVITAEDVGKFPDTNVAESLSHLTGISVDHQFGEGEKVSILGTDPALNRVLVNGQTIASGDWGGNPTDTSGRTFNYTLLSPEIIGTATVYKAAEAQIDEGSIGGTVVINTRRPLDLPANTFRGSVGYAYNDRSEKGNVRGSVLYSGKTDDKKFGALVTVTHDKEDLYRAGIEYWGFGTVGSTNAMVPFGMNSAFFKQKRQRDGVEAALQWKPIDALELNLTGIHIKGVYDNFSQSRYVVPAYWGSLDSNYTLKNNFVVAGHVTAGNATVNGVTLVGPAANPYNADGQYDTNLRKSTVKTDSLHLHGDYRPGAWHGSFDAGYTKATGGKDPEYLFSLMFNQSYSFSYDGENSSLTFDNPGAATDPTAYKTRKVGDQAGGIYYAVTDDHEYYGQGDFDRPVEWGLVKKIRAGAKYTDHVNKQNAWGNRIDVTSIKDLTAFSPSPSPSNLFKGEGASGDLTRMVVPSQDAVVAYLLSLPQGAYNIDKGSEWYVGEKNSAAYTQADFSGQGYRGNMGVRFIQTKDTSKYWQYDSATSTYSRVQKENTYSRFLPSINIVGDLAKDVMLRVGVSQAIARPRYSDLAGQFSLDNQRLTGGGGNPDLKPYESTNMNVALEWYINRGSMVSAEYFIRDINNYILSVTQDKVLYNTDTHQNATYSVSSPFNAGAARVKGIALTAQKELGLGFGIQANYTRSEADTTNGYDMPYLSKNSYNIIPYFERGPWTIRTSYSWRSEFFTSIGRLNSPLFADKYKQLDASIAYQINKNLQVAINGTNLLDSTYFWYYKVKYAPMGVYRNGRMLTLSLSYKL